jgi:NADH-quinone oxidoreductase subunit J
VTRFGVLLTLLLIVQLAWALLRATATNTATAQGDPDRISSVVELGRVLFTDYMFAFEATSILILVAMVGAVVLARKEGPQE